MEGEERGYWATKTYRSGKIGEKVKFFVPYKPRGKAREKSTPEKIASNARGTVREGTRCVNGNFRPGEGWLTLTYGAKRYAKVLARAERMREQDPEMPLEDRIWFAAQHEAELLMDRVRRQAKKQGVVLRYFFVTSDMDGDTGELVRIHHHMVVCGECVDLVREKWDSTEYEDPNRPEWKDRLWDTEDYTPLVEYMLKQVRHIPNAKKYTPSRNLMRAEPKPRKVRSGARLREPKGCQLLYADPYTGAKNCQYIRYRLPEEEWTGVWKRPRPGPAGGKYPNAARRADAGAPRAGTTDGAGGPGKAREAREEKNREVRCGGCGRLLGVIEKGLFVNKHGRQIIKAERAVVSCPKCGEEVCI